MAKLKRLDAFDESALWQRLESYPSSAQEKTAVSHLAASVRKVVEQAGFIGGLVVRHMPQYTLHNDRHFLNVLGIMDALVPKETLQRLHPLECALCILAAYTHDLGMALSDEEHAQLLDPDSPEGQHYRRFREGFAEELRQIERWEGIGGSEDGCAARHRRSRSQ